MGRPSMERLPVDGIAVVIKRHFLLQQIEQHSNSVSETPNPPRRIGVFGSISWSFGFILLSE